MKDVPTFTDGFLAPRVTVLLYIPDGQQDRTAEEFHLPDGGGHLRARCCSGSYLCRGGEQYPGTWSVSTYKELLMSLDTVLQAREIWLPRSIHTNNM